nr:MAG TPA: hypothetical protein [Caudoviricetes sp.]
MEGQARIAGLVSRFLFGQATGSCRWPPGGENC